MIVSAIVAAALYAAMTTETRGTALISLPYQIGNRKGPSGLYDVMLPQETELPIEAAEIRPTAPNRISLIGALQHAGPRMDARATHQNGPVRLAAGLAQIPVRAALGQPVAIKHPVHGVARDSEQLGGAMTVTVSRLQRPNQRDL